MDPTERTRNSPPGKASVWLQAIRPATLSAAVGPVAVGTALAAADARLHLGAAFGALLGAIFIQIGTNLFNDYADFEKGADTHQRVGPARATQRGWLTASQVKRAAYLSFALATLVGVYLTWLAGWPVLLIGIASVISGWLYTGGSSPLAYRGLGDAFVLLFFGVVAVCGTYFVQARSLSLTALVASLSVGALATAILVVNNLRDRHTDRLAAKRTLVVRYGARFGRIEYSALLATAYAVPLALWLLSSTARVSLGWLLPLASLPFALLLLRRVLTQDGAALNAQLAATARLGMLFNTLLAVGVLL